MKKLAYLTIIVFAFVFTACQDETYVKYTANSPLYMTYDDLREAVKSVEVHELINPGKIYFKDNYIYINEYMKGVHVYDNSNPSNPTAIAFIEIPGNVDIAIRGNFLYADSYIDLVVVDISDVNNPKEIDREQNIFEYTLPEYDDEYELATVNRDSGVVIDWEVKEIKELVKHENNYYPVYWDYRFDVAMSDVSMNKTGGGTVSGGGSEFGVGGSMARFGQYKDFLLVIRNSWTISTFSVDNDGEIIELGSSGVGWNIETMFLLDETMFIGSQQGMYIYDISNLPKLDQLSNFMHFTACDPVVADDKFAYITLRTGSNCGGSENVLEVVDVSDLKYPKWRKTYQMKNPHGLGIDGDVLFICDGEDGLKVFDASKPDMDLPKLAQFKDINAYDVIPMGTVLFMIGEDGFYQYDYSDLQNISLLSKIEVVKKADDN